MSQCQQVLKKLIMGESISTWSAMNIGIARLASRINNLRNGDHDGLMWPIESNWIEKGNKRWVEYRLVDNWQLVMKKQNFDINENERSGQITQLA